MSVVEGGGNETGWTFPVVWLNSHSMKAEEVWYHHATGSDCGVTEDVIHHVACSSSTVCTAAALPAGGLCDGH